MFEKHVKSIGLIEDRQGKVLKLFDKMKPSVEHVANIQWTCVAGIAYGIVLM